MQLALLYLLTVGVAASPGRADRSLHQVSRRSSHGFFHWLFHDYKDCTTDGLTFQHGDVYTLSTCVKYQCDDGQFKVFEKGCEVEGQCHHVGSRFEHHCHIYTCREDETHLWSQLTQIRCHDARGDCHDLGSTFSFEIKGKVHENCTCLLEGERIKYFCPSHDCPSCQAAAAASAAPSASSAPSVSAAPSTSAAASVSGSGKSTSGLKVGERDCHIGTRVIKNGEIFKLPKLSKCFDYRCDDGAYDWFKGGCELDGICHDEGTIFSKGCVDYFCRRTNKTITTEVSKRHCKDSKGKCHDQGSRFPYVMHGRQFESCTCRENKGRLEYFCDVSAFHTSQGSSDSSSNQGNVDSGSSDLSLGERDCFVRGRVIKNGAVFKIPELSKCFDYRCENGAYDWFKGGCELDGICHDEGTTFSKDCVDYFCRRTNKTITTEVSKRHCQDADDMCHNTGDIFPYVLSGRRFEHCTCVLTDDNLQYSCDA